MRKSTRKKKQKQSKGGRPRKTLRQLKVSGGYDRNPGRLLKRLGIESEPEPAPTPQQAEISRKWDEFLKLHAHVTRRDKAIAEACRLDEDGKPEQADRVLRKGGWDADEIHRRREYVNWKRENAS